MIQIVVTCETAESEEDLVMQLEDMRDDGYDIVWERI